jgi:hypothetical protein
VRMISIGSLEELAKEGSADALAQLMMVADALRESLRDYARQGKDGRNVVVKRFRERLAKVTSLVVQCQMTMSSPLHENHSDRQQTGGLSKEMLEDLVERSSSFQQG